jgi:hypothetical protein
MTVTIAQTSVYFEVEVSSLSALSARLDWFLSGKQATKQRALIWFIKRKVDGWRMS